MSESLRRIQLSSLLEGKNIMYSRRDFGRIALASLPLSAYAAKINSVVNGVQLGMITYNWREIPRAPGATDQLDPWIQLLTELGLGECELMCDVLQPLRPPRTDGPAAARGGQAPAAAQAGARGEAQAPRGRGTPNPAALKAREDLRQWRLTTPMSHFTAIRKKINKAGIAVHAYTCNGMGDDFTEAELDKVFEQAKALGANCVSSSTQVTVAQKLIPFAAKHKMIIAFHGHADVKNSNEFATAESYQKAFDMSKWYMANVDIGHMTAANIDAVAYIEKHHARINYIHVKDRKKDQGQNQPWGQGDTPVKEVLQLIKKNKYRIPCFVEYEYRTPAGSTTTAELKKCVAYMRQALA
jgi:sugar phosphate isomerase/epimerase